MRDPNERLVVVIVVALVLFALVVREARRGVRESGQGFTGVRAAGRATLPSTAACVGETCAPLTVVDVITPATLSPPHTQVLDRLGVMRPTCCL